jgi:HPr kinase/phosphorylase
MVQIHATCVALDGKAVLLRGPSGAGKSDLALRLIDGGAKLVADDRVELERDGGRIVAFAPPAIAGVIEARGIGLLRVGCTGRTPLSLVIDLVAAEAVERLPEKSTCDILGVALPLRSLAAFEASAPAKVRLAVSAVERVD